MSAVKKAKPKTVKACNCFAQVQEQLKEHNTKLRQEFFFNMKTMSATMSKIPLLLTEKIDTSKKKPPKKKVFCAYCPFCGKKYP